MVTTGVRPIRLTGRIREVTSQVKVAYSQQFHWDEGTLSLWTQRRSGASVVSSRIALGLDIADKLDTMDAVGSDTTLRDHLQWPGCPVSSRVHCVARA